VSDDRIRAIRVRDKRKPGHCWQDNELYDVFQPVIGGTATHIYAAMTRWAFGHRVEMGVREIAVESGTSRSAVQRAVVVMERLGMLRRAHADRVPGRRGASSMAYDLLDLKEAAVALGAVFDTHRSSHVLPSSRVDELRKELHFVPQGDENTRDIDGVFVPYGDMNGTLLSQKPGEFVPQGGLNRGPFNSLQDTRLQQNNPPLPLPPGGERGGSPVEELIDREAQRVVEACRFTSSSVKRAVVRQLRQVQAHSPGLIEESADRMIAHWASYCADSDLMRFTWGPRRFIDEGHWARPNTWPIDQEKLAAVRAARVGVA
jgi:IclR helix-turn-helix domain